jgi:hypothetical protein
MRSRNRAVVRRGTPAIGWAAAAILLLAACGNDGGPGSGEPILLDGRQAGFLLVVRIGSDTVDAGAPIDIGATLTWEAPAPRTTVWGSGSGPVTFNIEQLDGDIALGGAMTADCAPHEFERLVPVAFPFRKSGAFSDDDPNADFYRAYFADPVLRLPAGRWRVTASAGGYLEPCEMNAPGFEITLGAEILVR